MEKIGLILEGKTAQIFLETLLTQYHSSNFYIIITQDQSLIPANHPENFTFHHFDPTSIAKLKKALDCEFDSLFLIYENTQEHQIIYQILIELFPTIPLITPTKDPLHSQNHRITEVSTPLIISNKLLSYIPNIPAPSQDIGLGKGEIMEIPISPSSPYCYRTIGSIAQKDWKIAGIYRQNDLLLSTPHLSIQPDDKLLALGNPKILSNVYRQSQSSIGQFPIPFGKDLFLYLDEDLLDENEIMRDLDEAFFLHKQLKNSHHLNIILLNPKSFELIDHLKSLQNEVTHTFINYSATPLYQLLEEHNQKRIGLAILHHKIFHLPEVKKTLFKLLIPTFKTTQRSIQECQSSLILLEEKQNIASVALDISSQLNLEFEIYNFDVDGRFQTQPLEPYTNLAQFFSKTIKLTQSHTQNPIIYLLETQKPLLQFVPFDSSLVDSTLLGITSTHLVYHSVNLSKNPQILVPLAYEDN